MQSWIVFGRSSLSIIIKACFWGAVLVRPCESQGAGAFDLGDHREGQLSGQISPLNVFAIVLGCLAAFVAIGVTLVCAFFTWRRYREELESDPRRQPYSKQRVYDYH